MSLIIPSSENQWKLWHCLGQVSSALSSALISFAVRDLLYYYAVLVQICSSRVRRDIFGFSHMLNIKIVLAEDQDQALKSCGQNKLKAVFGFSTAMSLYFSKFVFLRKIEKLAKSTH